MKKSARIAARYGLPLAAALLAGSAVAQAPPPQIGGGPGAPSPGAPAPSHNNGRGPAAPMAPPPPPPPPTGAGDLPGNVLIPAEPIVPAPQTLPNMPALPGNNGNTMLPATGQGTLLRYRFHPGEVLTYQVKFGLDGTVQMGATGTKQPMKQNMEMTLTQTVQSVTPDDVATITQQVSSMGTNVNGKIVPIPAQALAQAEKPSTVVMTTTGQVKSIKMAAGVPGNPMMGMSPTQFSQMQGLPDRAVNIGDTWRSNVVSAETGMETHVLYTLSGLSADGDIAAIAQKIYVAFKPAKPGAGTPLPAGMKMNGLLTGTGLEHFDNAAGQLESQVNNMHLNLTITQAAGGVPITVDFDLNIDMERVDHAAASGATGATAPVPTPGAAAPAAPGGEPPTTQLQ